MSIYTEQLTKTITTQQNRSYRIHYISIALFIGIVVVSTVFTYSHFNSSRVSLASDSTAAPLETQRELPVTGVAGASKTAENDSGFATLATETTAPQLGTASVCEVGELFSIGDKETSPATHPADELSWVGALDVMPEYANPFVVGSSSNSDFPWRTASDNPDTLKTTILFNYIGSPAEAELLLGWSPGKQGEKQKEIWLDNELLGKTPLHQGRFDETGWEFMPLVEDTVDLSLTPGQHTLTVYSHSRSEGESVWDYITLDVTQCLSNI